MNKTGLAVATVVFGITGLTCLDGRANAQGQRMPWGQLSDMIAWEEFVQIVAPSGDPATKRVEFETWASDQDIYTKSPAQWPTSDAPKVLQPSFLGFAHSLPIKAKAFAPGDCSLPFGRPPPDGDGAANGSGFPQGACIGEEVRRNWSSFQYIVHNGLDSRSGLAKAFAANLKVDLPADAVEFKGDWAATADVASWLHVNVNVVRSHYYISTSTINGKSVEMALLSFHISSKQIKNWVWSDFENSMTPGRCDVTGCHDSFGAIQINVSSHATPYMGYGGCRKSKAVKAMIDNAGINAIWENYCLKGSQVSFVDGKNKPIILGNSVIEPLNAGVPIRRSSCMSCHAYASFDSKGISNKPILADPMNSPIGNVEDKRMNGYLANDFIWSPAIFIKP